MLYYKSNTYKWVATLVGCSDLWDAAFSGIPGVNKLVDNILIEAKDYNQLFEQTLLDRCVECNITISLKKMQEGESVVFAGYNISSEGA